MSKITRRDFLKTAGVMTLAVAAAGVLSGCEGNKPADPTTPPTADTVTIGDYTISVKAEQYSIKSYITAEGKPTNQLDERRVVVAMLTVKNNAVNQSAAEGSFNWTPIVENLERRDGQVTNSELQWVNNYGLQKLYKLAAAPVNGYATTSITSATSNDTAQGKNFFFAYEVAREEDGTFVKVPSFALRLHDNTEYKYHTLTAAIPSTSTDAEWTDLKATN